MLLLTILFYIVVVIFAVILVSSLIGIPCLPTHRKQARKMIELACIQPGQVVVDLGAGHGRLLFLAAKAGALAIGYELNFVLYLYIKARTYLSQQKKVKIFCRSLFQADVKNADIVFCFLFPGYMEKLEQKLFTEMKPGSKIIAYVFPFPNKQYANKTDGIFVYTI